MKQTKGIGLYLAIVFGVAFIAELGLYVLGYLPRLRQGIGGQAVLAALMWTPALAAFIASAVTRDRDDPKLRVWPLPKVALWAIALAVPALFAVVWSIITFAGWDTPNWQLVALTPYLAQAVDNPQVSLPPSTFFLVAGFILSVLLGMTVYAALLLGNEIGWRAYFYQKLLPMGRLKAGLLCGLVWGVWVMPLMLGVGLGSGDSRWLLFVRSLCMIVGLSMVLSELWRRSGHVGLVAVALGCFVSQVVGMWQFLFPFTTSPMSGSLGWVSAIFWLILGCVAVGLPGGPQPVTPMDDANTSDAAEPPVE